MPLLFVIELIQDQSFFLITFIKDVEIVSLSSFVSSLTKLAFRCYIVLLINVNEILDKGVVDITCNLTRLGVVKSASIQLWWVGFYFICERKA